MSISFEYDEYENDDISVQQVTIDGVRFEGCGDNSVALPKSALSEISVKDLDPRVWIEPAEHVEKDFISLATVPYRVQKLTDDRVLVVVTDIGRRKFWDGPVGFSQYMEAKEAIIKDRQEAAHDVEFISKEDDGDYIHLDYKTEINATNMKEVVRQAEQLIAEIEGATDLCLGSPFKHIDECEDEKDLARSVVIPLIRRLGFVNVRYNHGRREYGKDLTFAKHTEFDEYEFWGAQVKVGDVRGGAQSDLDMIIAQADDAFKMPFYDVYTGRKQRIAKFAVVVSGHFTENAVEKICEKIESHATRNNMVFVDGERIQSLAEKFRQLLPDSV